MKTKGMFIFIFGFFFVFLHSVQLTEIYKKKDGIKFTSQSEFKKCPECTSKEMAIAPDGSVFVIDIGKHSILKFDTSGNIKKFGKKGDEEGELFLPNSASIHNGKYLLVGNFPNKKRLSLFDLKGNFQKNIITENPAYSPISLGNNKVAYISWKRNFSREEEKEKEITVFIKDIEAGDEIEVISYYIPDPGIITIDEKTRIMLNTYYTGDVFIEKTKYGNLLVGLSTSPEISIYSPSGTKLKTFPLKMDPVRVTNDFRNKFRAAQIAYLKKNWGQYESKIIEKVQNRSFFNDHLPYFREILVDAEGNILVFKEKSSFHDESIKLQVYSQEGDFKCETNIDPGDYKLDIDSLRWFRKLHFTDKGIFALMESKNSDEPLLRIIKVQI